MRDELEEWYKAAKRNTSGDMVYDILKDWKEERATLKAEIERLKNVLRASEARHASDSELWTDTLKMLNACRSRMVNAFRDFYGALNEAEKQESVKSFWAADQNFCQHLMSLGGYGIDRKSERVATAEKEAL